jgi:tetratricopeptide (TPR) repeat protein
VIIVTTVSGKLKQKELLTTLLHLVHESGSNPDVVSAFLQSVELQIDNDFVALLDSLRQFFSSNSNDDQRITAKIIGDLGYLLLQNLPFIDPDIRIEVAIACFRLTSSCHTRPGDEIIWANAQNGLGLAYTNRVRGDRSKNIEMAIERFLIALKVFTRENNQFAWAALQRNCGAAYLLRLEGDRLLNEELAIMRIGAALEVFTESNQPTQWAITHLNLGRAYKDRSIGDPSENQEAALIEYSLALQKLTKSETPLQWASCLFDRASLYHRRMAGESKENLDLASLDYLECLDIYTEENSPSEWSAVCLHLGNVYDLLSNESCQNLAIQSYLNAISGSLSSIERIKVAHNLADIYLRREEWTNAIEFYDLTIAVIDTPSCWISTNPGIKDLIANLPKICRNAAYCAASAKNYGKIISYAIALNREDFDDFIGNEKLYPTLEIPPEIQDYLKDRPFASK